MGTDYTCKPLAAIMWIELKLTKCATLQSYGTISIVVGIIIIGTTRYETKGCTSEQNTGLSQTRTNMNINGALFPNARLKIPTILYQGLTCCSGISTAPHISSIISNEHNVCRLHPPLPADMVHSCRVWLTRCEVSSQYLHIGSGLMDVFKLRYIDPFHADRRYFPHSTRYRC